MDYDLSRLGSREFEHLTQAIAMRVLGNGVVVFGSGPDGGREATFNGHVAYPHPPSDTWTGYGVVQAKFLERSSGTADDNKWMIKQVKNELKRWANKNSHRRLRSMPKYLIFTTNAWLSGVTENGGIDSIDDTISSFAGELGLRGWATWGGDQICRYLDNFPEIRQAFAGFVTPGDVLESFRSLITAELIDICTAIDRHACNELFAGQWVRLNQAGSPDNEKLKLADIGVDLPGTDSQLGDISLVHDSIVRGDSVMRPSSQHGAPRHVVWIGGPGQGKSTLTQLLSQAYRSALLANRPASRLGPAAAVLADIRDRLLELKIPVPRCRRWPIVVRLNDYGDALASDRELTLLAFISKRIGKRLDQYISPAQVSSWLKSWPALVILDGLDEVAAADSRDLVEQNINEFLIASAEVDADLFVVGTTRPTGYNNEFTTEYFDQLNLRPLDVREAIDYACHLSNVRHSDDPDMAEQVANRLNQAAAEPITAKLMRTPLQVTIMTLLVERHTRVPNSRYALFDAFYETIYAREISKGGSMAILLEEHRNDINAIHQEVALTLHIRAETQPGETLLSLEELHSVTSGRLCREGFSNSEAEQLAGKIVHAATTRLILLSPVAQDHVGFDIRSLQEFMAAKAVATGGDSDVLGRMRVLAQSAHWRNTWLLAAGRIFEHSEHLRLGLVALLDELDSASLLNMATMPGSRIALDMLDDDTAARARGLQRVVLKHALQLIDQPPGANTERLAVLLRQTMIRDPETNQIVSQALSRALDSSGWSLLSAIITLASLADSTGCMQKFAKRNLKLRCEAALGNEKDAIISLARANPYRSLRSLENASPENAANGISAYAFDRLLVASDLSTDYEESRLNVASVISRHESRAEDLDLEDRTSWLSPELSSRSSLSLAMSALKEIGTTSEGELFARDLALICRELEILYYETGEYIWNHILQIYAQKTVGHQIRRTGGTAPSAPAQE